MDVALNVFEETRTRNLMHVDKLTAFKVWNFSSLTEHMTRRYIFQNFSASKHMTDKKKCLEWDETKWCKWLVFCKYNGSSLTRWRFLCQLREVFSPVWFFFFSTHLRSGRRRKQRKNYVFLMMFFNRKNSKFIHYRNIWDIKAGFKDKKKQEDNDINKKTSWALQIFFFKTTCIIYSKNIFFQLSCPCKKNLGWKIKTSLDHGESIRRMKLIWHWKIAY